MTDDDLRVIRRLAGAPEPTDDQRRAARAALQACIDKERAGATSRRWRPPVLVVAAAVLVVLVGAAGVISLRAPRATAGLLELAEATRSVAPTELTPGLATFTVSETTALGGMSGSVIGLADEEVVYLLSLRRETWTMGDGMAIRTTVGTPVFFSEEVERAYYAAGYDEIDRVGETFEEAFTGVSNPVAENDWPTTATALRQALVDGVGQGGSPLPEDVQVFKLAGSIVRSQPTQPALRAAILEVLAGLDITVTRDPEARTLTATIMYLDRGVSFTEYFTFNQDGYLVGDGTTANDPIEVLDIPAGTVIAEGRYSVPVQVEWEASG